MWTRRELKQRAKAAFKKNYIACLLVSLILTVAFGAHSSGGATSQPDDWKEYDYSYEGKVFSGKELEQLLMNDTSRIGWMYRSQTVFRDDPSMQFAERYVQGPADVLWTNISMILGGSAVILVLLLKIFVFAPLEVGGCSFFIRNTADTPGVKELAFPFKCGYYGKMVIVMILRSIYVMLWSLLLVIPGIVKSLEYRMVPYLLAEHPEMSRQEAFRISREMMDGQKWNAFLLDLSFIGWEFLATLTFGLAGFFYVYPYENAVNAELYLTLKQKEKCYEY
ncbi:MAG: DUF975 family protein [Eubacteriales bacterium]|nr:DUF975 family protein [Eubacteriales bacterium]